MSTAVDLEQILKIAFVLLFPSSGSLCRCFQRGRPVFPSHRLREHNKLPERHRHLGCRRRPGRRQPRKPVPRRRLLPDRISAVRIRVSLRQSQPMLRLENNERRVRSHVGQKQPPRSRSEHSLHCLDSVCIRSHFFLCTKSSNIPSYRFSSSSCRLVFFPYPFPRNLIS